MRFFPIIFLFAGCQEASLPLDSIESEGEKVTYLQLGYQEGAADDMMKALNSFGTSLTFAADKGATYEVKVLVDPWRNEQRLVHQETVRANSSKLDVGVYCSLAYSASEDAISIDRDQEQIVLELGSETMTKDVDQWDYRPIAVTSKAIAITEDEAPFLVMYHPNNMGADNFEMAVKHAKMEITYGEIVCTIRKVEQPQSEQDAPGQPANPSESE